MDIGHILQGDKNSTYMRPVGKQIGQRPYGGGLLKEEKNNWGVKAGGMSKLLLGTALSAGLIHPSGHGEDK
jgi:hypothetical protein